MELDSMNGIIQYALGMPKQIFKMALEWTIYACLWLPWWVWYIVIAIFILIGSLIVWWFFRNRDKWMRVYRY